LTKLNLSEKGKNMTEPTVEKLARNELIGLICDLDGSANLDSLKKLRTDELEVLLTNLLQLELSGVNSKT
jgi:hypothetical protein